MTNKQPMITPTTIERDRAAKLVQDQIDRARNDNHYWDPETVLVMLDNLKRRIATPDQ